MPELIISKDQLRMDETWYVKQPFRHLSCNMPSIKPGASCCCLGKSLWAFLLCICYCRSWLATQRYFLCTWMRPWCQIIFLYPGDDFHSFFPLHWTSSLNEHLSTSPLSLTASTVYAGIGKQERLFSWQTRTLGKTSRINAKKRSKIRNWGTEKTKASQLHVSLLMAALWAGRE